MTRLSPVRPLRRNTATAAALAAAFTLIAAGCGSDEPSSGGATATTVAAATTAAPAGATTTAASGGAGTTVNVTETEFKIELASSTFAPGPYTFAVTNSGEFKHNLVIKSSGGEEVKSDTWDPGKSGTVTATLAAGTYEFYCSIPTHKDKGMTLDVTVA